MSVLINGIVLAIFYILIDREVCTFKDVPTQVMSILTYISKNQGA